MKFVLKDWGKMSFLMTSVLKTFSFWENRKILMNVSLVVWISFLKKDLMNLWLRSYSSMETHWVRAKRWNLSFDFGSFKKFFMRNNSLTFELYFKLCRINMVFKRYETLSKLWKVNKKVKNFWYSILPLKFHPWDCLIHIFGQLNLNLH